MAIPQTPDLGLLAHLDEIKEPLLSILGLVVGLIVWAWTRMEKSIDKCSDALEAHAQNNEVLFDRLFTQLRTTDEHLNKLLGEHVSCKDTLDKLSRHSESEKLRSYK
jgi:hypothetical protein